MPSHSQADNIEHHKILLMNPNTRVKSSLQCQVPRLSSEKVTSLGERKPLKPGKAIEQNGPDQPAVDTGNSVPVIPLGNHHKMRPIRNVTEVDYVVKYMSRVPSYLQRLEKGDSVQEKALSFGVLDWGRLEKWMYLQKQVANKRGRDSPSSTNSSAAASFSTFKLSSQSTGSTDSPFAQRKQSLALNAHQNSCIGVRKTESVDGQHSAEIMSDSIASCSKPSGKGKVRYSNMKSIFVDKPQHQDLGSSSSTSKVNDIPDSAHNQVKPKIGTSRREETFCHCEQQSFPNNLYVAEDWLQDQYLVVGGMLAHLQESEHARHSSYDSATVSNRSIEVSRKSFSGNIPPRDFKFFNQSPQTPYSCPLRPTSQSDEPSVFSTSLSENEVLPTSVHRKHMKLDQSTESLSEKSVSNMADRSGQGEVKVAAAPQRELSPHRLLSAGMNRMSSTSRKGSSGQQLQQTVISHEVNATSHRRSRHSVTPHCLFGDGLHQMRNSSLREGSSGKEMKQTIFSDNSRKENAASSSRSRRSPLRRIFDPLLKSKSRTYFWGPDTLTSHRAREVCNGDHLPIQVELKSADEPCKSSDANINPSSQVTQAGYLVQAEKQVISTRQAFLRLSWKNGIPLFMFSTNDNEILAATMGKKGISQKNDSNCNYTMFTVHDLKKKSGVWMGRGNKIEKHDLVYNVVGQMRVSSSKSIGIGSKDYFVMREFVLFGTELVPTTHGCLNSQFNSELAAVVIQVPNERPENSGVQRFNPSGSSRINSAEKSYTENLHIEQQNQNSGLASIVAIIPRGVHGISYNGEPSPLIERWKSGGSCDCGGWDEGCMLTILTDKFQGSRSSVSPQTCLADGTPQIELFPQGEDRENKHTFTVTAYREGVCTIEFGPSITLLQAFAIAIATLHGRKPHSFRAALFNESSK